jgi:hypothetical protein
MMENHQKESAADRAVGVGWAQISHGGVHGSDHHQIDPAVFEAFPCQTIPRDLLDPGPVLTLMLGREFGLQAASLARISVCDLKKHCLRLLPLFELGRCPRPIAHRLFLCERWHSQIFGMEQPSTLSAALLCRARMLRLTFAKE